MPWLQRKRFNPFRRPFPIATVLVGTLVVMGLIVAILLQKDFLIAEQRMQEGSESVLESAPNVSEEEQEITNATSQLNVSAGDANASAANATQTAAGSKAVSNLGIGESIGEEFKIFWFPEELAATAIGSTPYRQYMRYGKTGERVASGRVVFEEYAPGQFSPVLKFESNVGIFEYGVVFDKGLRSRISGGKLVDLHGVELKLQNRPFTIIDSKVDTATRFLELQLIGEGKTVMLREDVPFFLSPRGFPPITPIITRESGDPRVNLRREGNLSKVLSEGEIYRYPNGFLMGIVDIMPNERGDGPDQAQAVAGGWEFVIADHNYSQNISFERSVWQQGQHHPAGLVQVYAAVDGEGLRIESIRYILEAESPLGDLFIRPGKTVAERANASFPSPGLTYGGLSKVPLTIATFKPSFGGYHLHFTSSNGQRYELPLVDTTAAFRYGDDTPTLWYIEGASSTEYRVVEKDYVLLTDQNTRKGVSSLLKVQMVDLTQQEVLFQDGDGKIRVASFSTTGVADQAGSGKLGLSQGEFSFFVHNNKSIAMDLNSDGDVAGDESTAVIAGGGILDLGSSNAIAGTAITLALTTEEEQIEDNSTDEVVTFTITDLGSELDITLSDQNTIDMKTVAAQKQQGLTNYGVMFTLEGTAGKETLTIEYPHTQRFVNLTVS